MRERERDTARDRDRQTDKLRRILQSKATFVLCAAKNGVKVMLNWCVDPLLPL